MTNTDSKSGFGTFKGVFLPSILTIFGVIMYLRLGWVVGHAGLFGTIVIVTISSAITFVTALSMASIATNMRVGAGGAYYMISRSFGLEVGAAVGLPLFLAQAVGISFYLAGFAESLHLLVPSLSISFIAFVTLVFLAILAFVSAELVLKTQLIILFVIIASLISFFLGSWPVEQAVQVTRTISDPVKFWVVFAVFFPAVTGIEAGVAMSGDLKKPSVSLPVGTLAAVLVGYAAYLILPIFLYQNVPLEVLQNDNAAFQKFARFEALVLAGIWGATLSSALGSLLGAPRTLQAMASDRVLPRILGRGHGPSNEPRIATVAAFVLAALGIMLGDLNVIAPVLSMFFLTSYGFLNLAVAVEGFIGSPYWRPNFRTPWWLSLTGAFGCFAVMMMIDAGSTFIAGFLTLSIFWITKRRNLKTSWFDLRRGILKAMARFAVYSLDEYERDEARTWRPNLLVLSGSPLNKWHLIELAHEISRGKGFLTVATLVSAKQMSDERLRTFERSVRTFLKSRKVRALVEVTSAEDTSEGTKHLIQSYGIGQIYPNTIVFQVSQDEEELIECSELVMTAWHSRRNLVLVKHDGTETSNAKLIRVWWSRKEKNSGGFALALAFLMQSNPKWRNSELVLSGVVHSEEERVGALAYMTEFLDTSRIVAKAEVFAPKNNSSFYKVAASSSENTDITFISLRQPLEGETSESYDIYFRSVLAETQDLRKAAYVLSSQNLDFHKIFS